MSQRSFEEEQRIRIVERINRYNDIPTVKDQLHSAGDVSPYQRYKIDIVSGYLYQALDRMNAGKYGICVICGDPISRARLVLVPAALACVPCDKKRET